MGSLTRAVYSGRLPLVHRPRISCKNVYSLGRFSSHFPHPTAHQPTLFTSLPLPPPLTLYRLVLSCLVFSLAVLNSLYFCYAVRAHTFSITITPRTNWCHKPSPVPYLLPIRLVFFFFLPLLVPSEYLAFSSWSIFSFSNSLSF